MSKNQNIVVLAGLPLTGKTAIGKLLSSELNYQFLDVDVARNELDQGASEKDRGSEEHEKTVMLRSYKFNHQKAKDILKNGRSVILAATYSRPAYHEIIEELENETGSSLCFFLITTSDEKIQERMDKRNAEGSKSNIRKMEDYLSVKNRYVEFNGKITRIDNSGDVEEAVAKIISLIPSD